MTDNTIVNAAATTTDTMHGRFTWGCLVCQPLMPAPPKETQAKTLQMAMLASTRWCTLLVEEFSNGVMVITWQRGRWRTSQILVSEEKLVCHYSSSSSSYHLAAAALPVVAFATLLLL